MESKNTDFRIWKLSIHIKTWTILSKYRMINKINISGKNISVRPIFIALKEKEYNIK